MIRTSIVPQTNHIWVSIPTSYIGKEIEILLYATDEIGKKLTDIPQAIPQIKKSFRGSLQLNTDEHESFQQHAQNIRNEWVNI